MYRCHTKTRLLYRLLNLELANDTSFTGISSGGDELFDLARMIKKQFAQNPQVDARRKTTLDFLLKLFQHRRLFVRGQNSYIDAIEVLRQSEVVSSFLPFKSEALAGCVGKFDEMAEEVRQQLPTVLKNIMQILSVQYTQYQKKAGPGAAAAGDVAAVRDHARVLITYVNKIPYRMPWDIMNELLAAHASIAG